MNFPLVITPNQWSCKKISGFIKFYGDQVRERSYNQINGHVIKSMLVWVTSESSVVTLESGTVATDSDAVIPKSCAVSSESGVVSFRE